MNTLENITASFAENIVDKYILAGFSKSDLCDKVAKIAYTAYLFKDTIHLQPLDYYSKVRKKDIYEHIQSYIERRME